MGGMVICPDTKVSDLTTSRGKSYTDLLAKYREAQRASAVASGKDYSKSSGIHTIKAGGQTFLCGKKRGTEDEEDHSDDEIYRAKAAKREAERERDAKQAAIFQKYSADAKTQQRLDAFREEAPDRLRLG